MKQHLRKITATSPSLAHQHISDNKISSRDVVLSFSSLDSTVSDIGFLFIQGSLGSVGVAFLKQYHEQDVYLSSGLFNVPLALVEFGSKNHAAQSDCMGGGWAPCAVSKQLCV
jgi:hypothetical protein